MKTLLIVCILSALPCARAAALVDDDLLDTEISTETAADYAAEEEGQASIQESDEDLAGFVQDYIGKDIALKGAFLLEDTVSGKVLKLSLESAPRRSEAGPAGSRVMEAVFKAAGGRKYSVLFYLQSAGFGGIDIFRIELKKEAAAGKK
ncbi:MAG TPA: hypothetical protein PL037_02675 [Elusimicrobiales bacterium]|nr:hypothetical protein [Elusimicrobiales bacterium]